MHLLKELAERYGPGSKEAFPKLGDAIFICMDIEALNGKKDKITELGFTSLDSRNIANIHELTYEQHMKSTHIIIKENVPFKNNNGKRRRWPEYRHGGANYTTDCFYPDLGESKEVYFNKVRPHVNHLFWIRGSGKKYDWVAPAGLKQDDRGSCTGPLMPRNQVLDEEEDEDEDEEAYYDDDGGWHHQFVI